MDFFGHAFARTLLIVGAWLALAVVEGFHPRQLGWNGKRARVENAGTA
jgi:hypothetical protein